MRPKANLGLALEGDIEPGTAKPPELEQGTGVTAQQETSTDCLKTASAPKRTRTPRKPKEEGAEKKKRSSKKAEGENAEKKKRPKKSDDPAASPAKKPKTTQAELKKAFAKTPKAPKTEPQDGTTQAASVPAPEAKPVLSEVLATKLEHYTKRLPTLLVSPPAADMSPALLAHPETVEQLKVFHETVTLENFFVDGVFSDVAKAVVAKLSHDSPLPLQALATQISGTLFPSNIEAGTKLIINCITAVAERDAFGLKPPAGVKHTDENKDYFWRWNIPVVYQPADLKPVFEKTRKAWQKRRNFIEQLQKFLAMAEGPKVDETKLNKVAEKIDKFEREAEAAIALEKQKLDAQEKANAKAVKKQEERAEMLKAQEAKKQEAKLAQEEKQKEKEAEKLRKEDERKKKEAAQQRKAPALTKFFQKQDKVVAVVVEKQYWYNAYMKPDNAVVAPLFRAPRRPDMLDLVQEEGVPQTLPVCPRKLAKRRPCSRRRKLLSFYENVHPPFNALWTKQSSLVNPRNPLARETNVDIVDYEYETDDGEEDEGEDLDSGGETDDDDPDREVKLTRADGLEEMEGFLEPEEVSRPGSPRKQRRDNTEPVLVGPYFEDSPNAEHAAALRAFRIQRLCDLTAVTPLEAPQAPQASPKPKAKKTATPAKNTPKTKVKKALFTEAAL